MLFISFLFISFLSIEVLGYGLLGHYIAASCVWNLLSQKTRLKIIKIVGNKEKFITLSGWPDRIKSTKKWKWTRRLHYLHTFDNPPISCKLPSKRWVMRSNNLISATSNYTKRFKKTKSVRDLGFMVHFIMDLHQPLHLVKKFRGGNDLLVRTQSITILGKI
jgi:hypothetical protein